MSPRKRLLSAVAFASVVAPLAGAAPAAAAGCPLSTKEQQSYPGTGYYQRLSATGISCSGAKDVMRAHRKCRVARGGAKGKCPSFSGWSCSESRRSGGGTYIGTVTCRKSGRKVTYIYQQDV